MSTLEQIIDVESLFGDIEYAVLAKAQGAGSGNHAAAKSQFHLRMAERSLAIKQQADLLEALQAISDRCPPYKGDYSLDATPSDFGNAEDYAREMDRMSDAVTGDIARAAISKATGSAS